MKIHATLSILFLLFCTNLILAQRDLTVGEVTNNPVNNNSNIDSHYHALLIGVSEYESQYISSLDGNPITDAKKLAKVLTSKYCFDKANVTVLENPTRSEIIRKFYSLSGKLTSEDNLLIFYAGHGYWDKKKELGYWLPSDSEHDFPDKWLYNSTLIDNIKSINSKHTLLISDACFSGSIFKSRDAFSGAGAKAYKKKYGLMSRKAITSGTLKTVPNESVFIKYLLKQLNNNEEKFISASQLFNAIELPVGNNSENTPQYGVIKNTGDEGGDFIFVSRTGEVQDETADNTEDENTNDNVHDNSEESSWDEEEVVKVYGEIKIYTEIQGVFYMDGIKKGPLNANTIKTLKKVTVGEHKYMFQGEKKASSGVIIVKKDSPFELNIIAERQEIPNQLVDMRDNKIYTTLTVGSQVWMAENLAYNNAQGKMSGNTPVRYSWDLAQTICPSGWRLPNNNDWKTLDTQLASSPENSTKFGKKSATGSNMGGTVPGADMFGEMTEFANTTMNNMSGGHAQTSDGVLEVNGIYGAWWSSSQRGGTFGWMSNVSIDDISRHTTMGAKEHYVRCIKK